VKRPVLGAPHVHSGFQCVFARFLKISAYEHGLGLETPCFVAFQVGYSEGFCMIAVLTQNFVEFWLIPVFIEVTVSA